jgi:SAM-dependent methyltransferase
MSDADKEVPLAGIDITRPNVARVYNYLIGGKDHYSVDRAAGDAMIAQEPDALVSGLEHRAFLGRAVRYMTAEAGIRQFIDVGSGLPSASNTHEIAQQVAPAARVVYVDNDQVAVNHGKALIGATDTTRFIKGDVRDPGRILDDPGTRELIDFSQPVGVLVLSLLHHIADSEDPEGIARTFRDVLAPGSHLAITHFCNPGAENLEQAQVAAESEKLFNENFGTGRWRFRDEIAAYFGDFELVEPGLVAPPLWRPAAAPSGEMPGVFFRILAGVARKTTGAGR